MTCEYNNNNIMVFARVANNGYDFTGCVRPVEYYILIT